MKRSPQTPREWDQAVKGVLTISRLRQLRLVAPDPESTEVLHS